MRDVLEMFRPADANDATCYPDPEDNVDVSILNTKCIKMSTFHAQDWRERIIDCEYMQQGTSFPAERSTFERNKDCRHIQYFS